MATNKKSVLLYCDIIHTVNKLSNENAGLLFKHYLKYINGKDDDPDPLPPNEIVDLAFEPIKQNLKRDLKKWEQIIEKRSIAGKASADSKKRNLTPVENVQQTSTQSTSVTAELNQKQSKIDFFFHDFPNSAELERVSMALKVTKEALLKHLPEFRKFAQLDYPNMMKFAEHFKNWYLKQSKNIELNNPKTTSVVFGEKKR